MASAPPDLFIRTPDAAHLTTASEAGEREVWTNDRHMPAAAPYFWLVGRSVKRTGCRLRPRGLMHPSKT